VTYLISAGGAPAQVRQEIERIPFVTDYLSTADGFKVFLGKEQEPGPAPTAKGGDNWANFIEAVRSRKQSDLNAPLDEGVPSVVLFTWPTSRTGLAEHCTSTPRA
jgi:hypothetical protein